MGLKALTYRKLPLKSPYLNIGPYLPANQKIHPIIRPADISSPLTCI